MFLVWKEDKPKASKASGTGALISVIITVVLIVIWVGLVSVIFSSIDYVVPPVL